MQGHLHQQVVQMIHDDKWLACAQSCPHSARTLSQHSLPNRVQPADSDTCSRERELKAENLPQANSNYWCHNHRKTTFVFSKYFFPPSHLWSIVLTRTAFQCDNEMQTDDLREYNTSCKHTAFQSVSLYGIQVNRGFIWAVGEVMINCEPKDSRPIIKMFHPSVWRDGCTHPLAPGWQSTHKSY